MQLSVSVDELKQNHKHQPAWPWQTSMKKYEQKEQQSSDCIPILRFRDYDKLIK